MVIESTLEVSYRIRITVCKLCVGVVLLSRSGHSFSQIDANENRDMKFDLTSNGIRLSCNQQVVNCGPSKIGYVYIYTCNFNKAFLDTLYQKWSGSCVYYVNVSVSANASND